MASKTHVGIVKNDINDRRQAFEDKLAIVDQFKDSVCEDYKRTMKYDTEQMEIIKEETKLCYDSDQELEEYDENQHYSYGTYGYYKKDFAKAKRRYEIALDMLEQMYIDYAKY